MSDLRNLNIFIISSLSLFERGKNCWKLHNNTFPFYTKILCFWMVTLLTQLTLFFCLFIHQLFSLFFNFTSNIFIHLCVRKFFSYVSTYSSGVGHKNKRNDILYYISVSLPFTTHYQNYGLIFHHHLLFFLSLTTGVPYFMVNSLQFLWSLWELTEIIYAENSL